MQLATSTVIVLDRDSSETFELPKDLDAELAASIAEADRGEVVSAAELFERLRRIS
jgi:hypothetical protein